MKALAVAAGIVFWTLVLGIAWLAFFPGSESDGPVAVLQIEPITAPGAGKARRAPHPHLALRQRHPHRQARINRQAKTFRPPLQLSQSPQERKPPDLTWTFRLALGWPALRLSPNQAESLDPPKIRWRLRRRPHPLRQLRLPSNRPRLLHRKNRRQKKPSRSKQHSGMSPLSPTPIA